VLSLPDDAEAGSFQRPHGVLMIDAWNPAHG
jgi:hypothetical protein